jgi:hypothetical protein
MLAEVLNKLTPCQMAEMILEFAERKTVVSYLTVRHWISLKGYDEIIPIRSPWKVEDILNHAG